MENVIRYHHAVNAGDMVASMAGLKSIYEQSGKKAFVYQQLNRPATYYANARHEVKDERGVQVTMNQKQFDLLRPLIISQDYIEDYLPYTGQQFDVDLDLIRSKIFTNLPYLAIQSWIFLAFPDMAFDLSRKWIEVDADNMINGNYVGDKVIVNFTERYRTETMDYFFLKKYENILLFAGTEHEHALFCERWQLDFPRLQVSSFLRLAQALKACRFLLSNQSMQWNIAEAMKTPRLLELSQIAPNCQPFIGENSYGYFHGGACEYYFNKLLNS